KGLSQRNAERSTDTARTGPGGKFREIFAPIVEQTKPRPHYNVLQPSRAPHKTDPGPEAPLTGGQCRITDARGAQGRVIAGNHQARIGDGVGCSIVLVGVGKETRQPSKFLREGTIVVVA